MASGLTFIDTAEVYGFGKSEEVRLVQQSAKLGVDSYAYSGEAASPQYTRGVKGLGGRRLVSVSYILVCLQRL